MNIAHESNKKERDIMSVKKLSLAGILVAVGVVCSAFYIPIGV
ncbi:MAG TPA: hypothetical protein VN131_03755 [Mobilitalea sp.]|nr:hypothetical protein [Mobilitalea sp.]